MFQRARDNGVHIKSSSSSDSGSGTTQQDDQDLRGNQAIQEELAGQACPCGGIATGLYTTEPSEAVDEELRHPRDVAWEEQWAEWVNYPESEMQKELELVELYNHAFDDINAEARSDIEGRYEGRMNNGVLDPMWAPEQAGNPWSGFQGDLEYTGTDRSASGLQWTPNNNTLGDAFPDTTFDDPTGAGYGMPVKGYQHFTDQAGKETSHVSYGFAQSPPISVAIYQDVLVKHHWCVDHKRHGMGSRYVPDPDGKDRKPMGVEGYVQCEEVVYRENRKGKRNDETVDDLDRLMDSKVREAQEWKAFHEERHEYIDTMAAGPGKNLKKP